MTELKELYELLKAHKTFYRRKETEELIITLSYEQVKILESALSGFVELNSPNENWLKY